MILNLFKMFPKSQKWVLWTLHDTETGPHRWASKAFIWASFVYGCAAKLRRTLYQNRILKAKRLPCPVISVGNLTVGGTGKTPMVAYLANLLKGMGYRAAVLSRGYKGKAQKCGGVVSDGSTVFMTPEDAGDEPFMLAEQLEEIPVLVGSNRFASGTLAVQQYRSNVLILDDGFQHLALERDLNLVLLDHRYPVGNGHLLPRGTLREPLSALSMADGVIFTRCDPCYASAMSPPRFLDREAFNKKPFFYAAHYPMIYRIKGENPKADDVDSMAEKRGIAFSGIAQNDDFQHSLKAQHYDIVNFFGFPDHHPYTQKELEFIWLEGRKRGAFFVATTQKDYVRIRGRVPTDIPLMVLGIRLQFLKNDGVEFSDWVRNHVEEAMRKT